ncbi:MAG: nitrate reductase [Myxococcota bacterium]|nr:nitrate reductase [Myxococcota bacterium]
MSEEEEPRLGGAFAVTRRDVLRIAGALGLVSAGGGVAWGGLEFLAVQGQPSSWHKSVCRYCGSGCGVSVGIREGQVVEVRGDEDAHNRGKLCVKGTLLPQLTTAPGRVLHPQIRENGSLRRASWDEAMTLVASRFREAIDEAGPDAVAYYGSGQLLAEESYTANKLFKAGIGTNNVDGNPRLCMASAAVGYTRVFGKDEPPGAYEDIDHADVFFIIGANPAECHQPIFERVLARKRMHPETKIVCVDPRRTLTAEHADLHLAPRPGSDLLLLWSMAHVMLRGSLVDRDFVESHVSMLTADGTPTDWDGLAAFLEDYAPDRVSERLGVPASRIVEVAHLFAAAPATMSLWTMGLNQRVDGSALNTTVNGLHLLAGQIGRPGATPLSMTGQSNACGGVRDTGTLAHALPHGRMVANPAHRAEMEELWGVPAGRIAPEPGLDAIALFAAMAEGRVRCLLNMCTNPGQSLPNLPRHREGLERAFLVVVDAFEDTATSRYADVVLPAALWIEKEGVYGQTERRYQLIEKLVDPPGEARSDLEILVDLAERLGFGELITAKTSADVWEEYRALSRHSKYDFSGMTRERLHREHGIQWPCPSEGHPGTVRRYVPGDPFVADGRAFDFYGNPDHRARLHLTPYEERSDPVDGDYPLVLTTGRIVEQWHTGTMTDRIPAIRNNTPRGHFELHASDAEDLGVEEGDRVRVVSRYGSIDGPARVSLGPRPGTLFAAFYDAAWLVNQLVTDRIDPFSKQPDFKTTAVRVEKIRSEMG